MKVKRAVSGGGPSPANAMCAGVFLFIPTTNSHSYTHLILALGIVREPTAWGFITSTHIFDEK